MTFRPRGHRRACERIGPAAGPAAARTAGTLSEARRSLFQNACWGLDRWCPGCQIRLIRTRAANLAAGQLLRPREHHSANACSPPPLLNGHVSSLPPY